jgi:lipopolysaccharide transport system permease protein
MKLVSRNAQAFSEAISLIIRYRTLILEMARRELLDRYAGQALGLFWTIAHPIFMMGLYVFIFVVVFKTKIGDGVTMPLDYTTYILAGLIPWLGVQEALSKASTAVTSNANLVNQVIFPVEVLPVKATLATGFTQVISIVLLLLYVLIYQGVAWATFILIPLLMLLQMMMLIGFGFLLAATGVFFRDLKDFVQLYCIAGAYLVPVFYLPEWVPGLFKTVIYSNPFSYMVWCYQDAIYYGRIEHPIAWVVFPLSSILVFLIGYRVMRRLKPMLGNVL